MVKKCVVCGTTREEHKEKYGRDITVDHIDGNGKYSPRHLKNNALSNLQTLCMRCHGIKDGKRGQPMLETCKRGHSLDDAYISTLKSGKKIRTCKPCAKMRSKEQTEKNRTTQRLSEAKAFDI